MTSIVHYHNLPPLRERLAALQKTAWESPGSLTLWVGAGFGKLYANLPIWGELLDQLSNDVPNVQERELVARLIRHGRLQVAAELLTELCSDSLTEHLCRIFDTKSVNVSSNPLRRLHPGTVITTNYDTLLERIFPEYRMIRPRDPIESIFNFRPKLVKLHGSISDPSSIVLNVTSYARAYDKELEWFLAHIFQNTTVLFVGAGLADSEPYMRFIRLLGRSGLLHTRHYALMPFELLGTEVETNRVITDRSNMLESIGIRTLPYVVSEPEDHRFVDELLAKLQPKTTESASKVLLALEKALELYGPENVGPPLFRLFATLDQRQLEQKPFLVLVTKFLRSLREQQRKDLGRMWKDRLIALVSHHEAQTTKQFPMVVSDPIGNKRKSSKAREIDENKSFLFDAGSL